jgi:hypothetical protein
MYFMDYMFDKLKSLITGVTHADLGQGILEQFFHHSIIPCAGQSFRAPKYL